MSFAGLLASRDLHDPGILTAPRAINLSGALVLSGEAALALMCCENPPRHRGDVLRKPRHDVYIKESYAAAWAKVHYSTTLPAATISAVHRSKVASVHETQPIASGWAPSGPMEAYFGFESVNTTAKPR